MEYPYNPNQFTPFQGPSSMQAGIQISDGATWSIHASLFGSIFFVIVALTLLLASTYFIGKMAGRRIKKNELGDIAENSHVYESSRRLEFTMQIVIMLIGGGFLLFLLGASGSITIELPGAKLITSLPGIVTIFLGYKLWSNKQGIPNKAG